jgi:hypothetical protein
MQLPDAAPPLRRVVRMMAVGDGIEAAQDGRGVRIVRQHHFGQGIGN